VFRTANILIDVLRWGGAVGQTEIVEISHVDCTSQCVSARRVKCIQEVRIHLLVRLRYCRGNLEEIKWQTRMKTAVSTWMVANVLNVHQAMHSATITSQAPAEDRKKTAAKTLSWCFSPGRSSSVSYFLT
jgi:hypothetical protein